MNSTVRTHPESCHEGCPRSRRCHAVDIDWWLKLTAYNETYASMVSGTLLGVALVITQGYGAPIETPSYEYPRRGVVVETYHHGGLNAQRGGSSFYTLMGGGDLRFRERRSQEPKVVLHLESAKIQEIVEFAVNSGLAEARPIGSTYGIIDAGMTFLSLTLSRYESPTRSAWGGFTKRHGVTAPKWRLQYEPNNRRVAAIAALTTAFREMKSTGAYVAPTYPDSFFGDHEGTYWDDPPGPWRGVRKGKFRSYRWPEITIDIDNRLSYQGSDRYVLLESRVERHHWVEEGMAEPKAMLIIRFESMLDNVEHWRHYQARDFPEALPAEVLDPMFSCIRGSFLHDVVELDWHRSFPYSKALDSLLVTPFLKGRGFSPAATNIASRFVHVAEINPRSRMTIFYLQPLPAGTAPGSAAALHKKVLADSLSAFRIEYCGY